MTTPYQRARTHAVGMLVMVMVISEHHSSRG